MSQADPSKKTSKAKKQSGVLDDLLGFMERAIDDIDEQKAADQVATLIEDHPNAASDELVELLTKRKCMQTGAVGAVTSGTSLIPGLGTLTSLTFGVAADIGMTFKMQAEMVLEIAAVYQHKLAPDEKKRVVMLVTGISAGANQALRKAGQRVAEKASQRLAQKSVTKAIPVIGVAASAGSNILLTYVIGHRANAYFSLGPEAVGDWRESIRAVTVDERIIVDWLTETTERSWRLVSDSAQSAVGSVIVAGKSAGEVVVVGAGKAGEVIAGVGRGIANGAGTAAGAVAGAGKKAGTGVAAAGRSVAEGTTTAAGAVAGAGRKAGERVASGAKKAGKAAAEASRDAAEGVASAGKKVGAGIAAGVGKAGEATAGAGKSIGAGASAAKQRASKALKVFKRGKAKEEGEEEKGDEVTTG